MGTMDGFLRLQRERYGTVTPEQTVPVGNGTLMWVTRWGVYVDESVYPVGIYDDESSAEFVADDWAEHGYSGRVSVRPFRLGEFLAETKEVM